MGLCAECVLRQAQSPGGCGGCHVAPFAACAGGGRGFAFDVGVGGGVVKGMTFYGIKRTYQGFARFQQIGFRTFPKTLKSKNQNLFFGSVFLN